MLKADSIVVPGACGPRVMTPQWRLAHARGLRSHGVGSWRVGGTISPGGVSGRVSVGSGSGCRRPVPTTTFGSSSSISEEEMGALPLLLLSAAAARSSLASESVADVPARLGDEELMW